MKTIKTTNSKPCNLHRLSHCCLLLPNNFTGMALSFHYKSVPLDAFSTLAVQYVLAYPLQSHITTLSQHVRASSYWASTLVPLMVVWQQLLLSVKYCLCSVMEACVSGTRGLNSTGSWCLSSAILHIKIITTWIMNIVMVQQTHWKLVGVGLALLMRT